MEENAACTTTASPPARCPRCGYRVYLPCLICTTREFCKNKLRCYEE